LAGSGQCLNSVLLSPETTWCSFLRVLWLVFTFCLFQGISGIGCPRAGAQTVSQLNIQNVDYIGEIGTGGNPTYCEPTSRPSCDARSEFSQCRADASQFSADDTDNLASDERYDWCAGYALYRYTLEVNGVEEFQIPQWERALRRYCTEQAKARYYGTNRYGKEGTERQSDDSDWRTIFDIDFISQIQSRQFGFVNFQDRKVSEACGIVDWRHYFGGKRFEMSKYGYGDIFTLSQGLLISHNVQGSNDPAIGTNDKSRTVHSAGINLNYRGAEASARLDLSEWLREVLAINCGGYTEQDEQTAQPHIAPSAGEAH
jgi:hypothetical protein